MKEPIKYYSDLHHAYLVDFNRCPSCGSILVWGAGTGQLWCVDDNCELECVLTISKEAKDYFDKAL